MLRCQGQGGHTAASVASLVGSSQRMSVVCRCAIRALVAPARAHQEPCCQQYARFIFLLQADNEQLETSLAAATAQVSKLQAQLASLSELQEGLQASLEGKQSAEASLMAQLTQVCGSWSGFASRRRRSCVHQSRWQTHSRNAQSLGVCCLCSTQAFDSCVWCCHYHCCCRCRRHVPSWTQLRPQLQRSAQTRPHCSRSCPAAGTR